VITARGRLGRETVRRWIVQAEVDGIRPGVASSEHAEIKALKAQVRRLEEDNAILKAATSMRSATSLGPLTPRVDRCWPLRACMGGAR
jgi:transposase-like protein